MHQFNLTAPAAAEHLHVSCQPPLACSSGDATCVVSALRSGVCIATGDQLPASPGQGAHQGTAQALPLSTGFPYKLLPLHTEPDVPWLTASPGCHPRQGTAQVH
jgi:hypothetical protein